MSKSFQWEGQRVLLTGATGFVGQWLARALLLRGARVTCLVLPREIRRAPAKELAAAGVRLLPGRITDPLPLKRALSDEKIETVFHLAALNFNYGAHGAPAQVFETNARGTWMLLDACRRTPSIQGVALASSVEVEGIEITRKAQRKSLPLHPYRASKCAAELVARAYSDTYGLPVGIVRCDNLYGGGDLNWSRLIPGTIYALARGESPVLRSSGRTRRDYLYVEDMVDAYLAVAAALRSGSWKGRIFHFATGRRTSAIEVVSMLSSLMKRPDLTPIIRDTSCHERRYFWRFCPNTLFKHGWASKISLEKGLKKTVIWYRNYFRRIGLK